MLHVNPELVANYTEGQIVVDSDGVFLSARLPNAAMLDDKTLVDLGRVVSGWEKRAHMIPRGAHAASISVKFFGGGLKGDQDSRLGMPHSQVAGDVAEQVACVQVQNQLRALMRTHVLPRVQQYFFDLLDAPCDMFHEHGLLHAFVSYFCGATCGHLFFNRHHADDDLWVTILVALGACTVGGGFAHMEAGVIHAVHAGHILVVNPARLHSTCEFGDAHATRHMIALFVSTNVFRACTTSVHVAHEHDLSMYAPHGGQRRRRHGKRCA